MTERRKTGYSSEAMAESTSGLMAKVEDTISAEELLVSRHDSEFFEDLGRTASSLSGFSKFFGGKQRKPKSQSIELPDDVTIVKEEDDHYDDVDSDDGDKEAPPKPSKKISFTEDTKGEPQESLLRPVASWVKSMNHFEMRKAAAEELVRDGVVYSHVPESAVVPIQQQVDLDLYSYEEQRKRWEAGQSPKFQALCQDLWALVRDPEEDMLRKDQYMELVYRFHYICCPPPLESSKVMASAEQDWTNDSHGKDAMDYPAFFRAIFQCVDIWTETTNLTEYIALLKRLIRGAAIRNKDNTLMFRRRQDVKYDNFFDVEGGASINESQAPSSLARAESAKCIQALVRKNIAKRRYQGEHAHVIRAQEAMRMWLARFQKSKTYKTKAYDGVESKYKLTNDASVKKPETTTTTKKRRKSSSVDSAGSFDVTATLDTQTYDTTTKRRGSNVRRSSLSSQVTETTKKVKMNHKVEREALLSFEQTNAMIAKCYQAKMQADAAAMRAQRKGKSYEKSVRFDLFVVRFFKRSHGTIGIARRHLRVFVRSIEAMLHADDDDDDAVEKATHPRAALFAEIVGVAAASHNARLMPHYLLPVLRNLYPDMMAVARRMTSGDGNTADPVPMHQMVEALENAMPAALRDAEILAVLEKTIEPAKIDKRRVDPDQALWLALPTFKRLDLLLAFRRKRCANVAQDYAKLYLQKRRAQKLTSPRQKLDDAIALDKKLSQEEVNHTTKDDHDVVVEETVVN